MNRFVSIILQPGWFNPRHGVVDLNRNILLCECTEQKDADTIAATLNIQHQEREAKQLEEPQLTKQTT